MSSQRATRRLFSTSIAPFPHVISAYHSLAQQKQHFIHALTSTSWGDLESDLPHKLAPLHVFKSYFSMYELARTAYSLVLESPTDIARWRALAKLDSYADGEASSPYEAARREALTLNPRLFDHCPQFHAWSDSFRR